MQPLEMKNHENHEMNTMTQRNNWNNIANDVTKWYHIARHGADRELQSF